MMEQMKHSFTQVYGIFSMEKTLFISDIATGCTVKRTFLGQNKSTFLILHPVFRIFREIQSFVS